MLKIYHQLCSLTLFVHRTDVVADEETGWLHINKWESGAYAWCKALLYMGGWLNVNACVSTAFLLLLFCVVL